MVIYRSFYDAIKLLPDDTQLEIFRAIYDYGLDGFEPELSKSALPFWTLIKPNIQANRKKWESGCKAKRKQSGSNTEAKGKQSTSKTEAKHKHKASTRQANVDVDVDEDANVDVNEDANENAYVNDFEQSVYQFEAKYGKPMIDAFYAYWTEPDKKGKLRYQAEKFFDIGRRLTTWSNNNFRKNQNSQNRDVPPEPAARKVHESFNL